MKQRIFMPEEIKILMDLYNENFRPFPVNPIKDRLYLNLNQMGLAKNYSLTKFGTQIVERILNLDLI